MTEKNRDSKTSIAVLATATTVLGLAFPVLAITVRHAASAIQFALALTCVAALVTRPWRQLRLRRGQGAAVAWIFGAWPLLVGGHMLLNGYFDGPALERALRFALAAMALCVLTHLRATPLRRIGTAFALGAIGSVYVALESCWHALPGQLLQCRASNGFTNPVPFGGMALTLECGQHEDPAAPDFAWRAIRNTLAHLGLTDETPPPARSDCELLKLVEVIDRLHAGDTFARPWASFDPVSAGELIGTREDGSEVRARRDGFIVFPNPAATPGNEWFYFAQRSERVLHG